jgi:hypothetical protein
MNASLHPAAFHFQRLLGLAPTTKEWEDAAETADHADVIRSDSIRCIRGGDYKGSGTA